MRDRKFQVTLCAIEFYNPGAARGLHIASSSSYHTHSLPDKKQSYTTTIAARTATASTEGMKKKKKYIAPAFITFSIGL